MYAASATRSTPVSRKMLHLVVVLIASTSVSRQYPLASNCREFEKSAFNCSRLSAFFMPVGFAKCQKRAPKSSKSHLVAGSARLLFISFNYQ